MAEPWPPEAFRSASGDRARDPSIEAPVTVHIGRLEVRAILPEPAREQRPDVRSAPPDPLSLSDYLRGQRASG